MYQLTAYSKFRIKFMGWIDYKVSNVIQMIHYTEIRINKETTA